MSVVGSIRRDSLAEEVDNERIEKDLGLNKSDLIEEEDNFEEIDEIE